MKKQTAVEWLENQLKTRPKPLDNSQIDKLFEQAKEMEKQQIMDALKVAFTDGIRTGSPILKRTYKSPYKHWEQYYKEKYGK